MITHTKFSRDSMGSRRDFIKAAGALGLAAATSNLIGSKARAAEPKRGGKFRQALKGGATSDSLWPGQLTDSHPWNVSTQIRSTLTEVSPTGELIGELAESFEPAAGGAQWLFKLRKGVEFHNGKSLTPEDVIYSLNQHRGPGTKSQAVGIMSSVTDIKADGGDTVRISLKGPNVDFPYVLAFFKLAVGPEGTTGAAWDKGIGTGPYILTSWQAGVRATTKRNPNYFKPGKPYFDEVETLNVPDDAARFSALQSGRVDAIESPDFRVLAAASKLSTLKIIEVSGNTHYTFPMLTNVSPFDNADLRQALKFGVNRDEMVKKILRGHGYVGNDHPIGRNQPFFAKELAQTVYDPDKAKFHMKKAGLGDISLDLHAADAAFAGAIDAAQLYQIHAEKAGIKIKVVREPNDGYWGSVWRHKPWSACFWTGRTTADWILSEVYASDASANDTNWKNVRFDQLLAAARSELDNNKRAGLYADLQEILRDDGGTVIPMFANVICAVDSRIQTGAVVGSDFPMDGEKNHERWWFA
ncbi:ABC transporter substrate-binding protein [Mesorhizobium sp. CA8]|uniref:ABC transporter substrate-binding protein n=1 Tax=unclassified Mesorhizobium TaxID=325217 RepID=UPI001CCFC6ED|nr:MULTISPECIES: ABC transporter substrate-binding protein [unclassified Mesorhizobium]MBZ9765053.1 ABC transporter substrate-binding protein [Mesorhizobium sp. CA8]MBZ9823485.1 ABC transporter substrate-binding protein [Mesorhizobium sp. CA4]